jgi:hypothetical protein
VNSSQILRARAGAVRTDRFFNARGIGLQQAGNYVVDDDDGELRIAEDNLASDVI